MSTVEILILGLIFVAVTGSLTGAGLWLLRRESIEQRLREVDPTKAGRSQGLDGGDQNGGEWQVRVARAAAPIARLAAPAEGWEQSYLRVRLMHAGYRRVTAPVFFFAAKTLLALALPGMFMLVQGIRNVPLAANVTMIALLLLAAIGYIAPNVFLDWKIRRRQLELFEAFPDAVDLMVVCVEAGLGLDAAINRAGTEMELRCPKLAEEFNLIALQLRVGATRERALKDLALRIGLDEIASFVSMVVQAERFGTNMADSLRIYADTLRTHRQLRAEEAAAKIPLKLLFPLIFCIFPALMVVLMGPAAIKIYRILLPTFGRAG